MLFLAHFEKFNRSSIGNILTHNTREDNDKNRKRNYSNKNINKELTKNNYSLFERKETAISRTNSIIKEIQGEKKLRKDAVILVGLCITTPLNTDNKPILNKEQEEQFFRCCYSYLTEKFPYIVSADVHYDEQINIKECEENEQIKAEIHAHLHFTFVPVVEKNEVKKICAKEVINREMLRSFHSDLQSYLDEHLDFECPIYREDKPTKSNLSLQEYKTKKELENLKAEKENDIKDLENDYIKRFKLVEDNTYKKLNELQDQYNTNAKKLKDEYKEKIVKFEDYTNKKLLECQSLIDERKELYNNMCIKINKKKEEEKELLSSKKDSSILLDFKNLGTQILGKNKVFNEKEIEHLTEKITVIETKYNYYKNNQNIIEELNNQHKNEMQGMNNKLEVLRDNIQDLEDENAELRLYKNYVDDKTNIKDFETYASTKKIIKDEVFDYDRKLDRYHKHKVNKIIDINEYKENKNKSKELSKENEIQNNSTISL